MRAALVIAAKDLRQRLRDRSAIVLVVVAPLVISALMSVAFASTEEFHADVAVVDLDRGPVAGALGDVLASDDVREILTVSSLATVDAARDAVRDGDVGAAIVVPKGVGDAGTIDVLTSVDSEIAGEVATAIVDSFAAQVNAVRLAVATAVDAGATPAEAEALVADAARQRLPETVVDRPIGARRLKAISYYGPGMGIFFVLFAIGFTARSFFTERREGTLDRIAAAPVSPFSLLAGKALSVFVYGAASLLTITTVTTVAFGADWGDPLAVAAVCVAMALAVVALTAFVITASRSDRQADGIASVVIFALALLGGNFVFVSVAPALMRTLALLTPNGWALRAFTDLATGGGGLGAVAQPVAAILAFTAVVGAVAAALARRVVLR